MTGWDVGRWVAVSRPDGTSRYDWVPDEQPPSPDGAPGWWHAVGAPGEPGTWEWHPADAGSDEPADIPPAVRDGEPFPGPWLGTPAGYYGPGVPSAGRFSRRSTLIGIGASVAVLAAVVLLVRTHADDGSSDRAADTAATHDTAPAGRPAPTPGTSAVGADTSFPKVSGQWTLFTVTIDRDAAGNFTGTGVVGYQGAGTAQPAKFDLAVFSGGRQVVTLHAATSDARPRTPTTVRWTSNQPWVEQEDGFTFAAR